MALGRIEWHDQSEVNEAAVFLPVKKHVAENGSELELLTLDSAPLFRNPDGSNVLYVLRKTDAGSEATEHYSDLITSEGDALTLYNLVKTGVLI